MTIRPPSTAEAFHCRAAASSWSISRPLASSKTGRASSPRSTPHWYQESSQATVIRTSLGAPAEAPTETQGAPSVRTSPATVRPASLALKRFAARSKGLSGEVSGLEPLHPRPPRSRVALGRDGVGTGAGALARVVPEAPAHGASPAAGGTSGA